MPKIADIYSILKSNVAHRLNHRTLPEHMVAGCREDKIICASYIAFETGLTDFYKENNMDIWTSAETACSCCVVSEQKSRDEKWAKLVKTYERNRRSLHN